MSSSRNWEHGNRLGQEILNESKGLPNVPIVRLKSVEPMEKILCESDRSGSIPQHVFCQWLCFLVGTMGTLGTAHVTTRNRLSFLFPIKWDLPIQIGNIGNTPLVPKGVSMAVRRRKVANSGELFSSVSYKSEADTCKCSPEPPPAPVEPPPPEPERAIPPAPAPPVALAVREVLSLPPALLGELPEPSTLALRTQDGARWWVTTSRARYTALRTARDVVFTGGELGAIAIAAELGRASQLALAQWLAAKRTDGAIRLDVSTALDGLIDLTDPPSPRWDLARVLYACGATLETVTIGDDL